MIISQAIYTSANAQFNRGYHLVARSPGIPENVAQGLCRWSPSHGCLGGEAIDAESINFFQPARDWFSISRSVYGCPEYSQRGGMRIVTIHLIFDSDQLACFDNDAIRCARIATSMGLLSLPLEIPRTLSQIEFPNSARRTTSEPFESDDLQYLLQAGKPFALLGSHDPFASLERLLQTSSTENRSNVSFSTGLKPSAQRPFQVQFFPSADIRLKRELSQQGVSIRDWPKSLAQAPSIPRM